jgi:hypothetical protein
MVCCAFPQVTVPTPREMAMSADGAALWVNINNGTIARYDATRLCTKDNDVDTTNVDSSSTRNGSHLGTGTVLVPSASPVPSMTLPASDLSSPSGAFSVSPVDGSVAICDLNSSQVAM